MQTAGVVRNMARELGVQQVFVVANKVRGEEDLNFIRKGIEDMELIGFMSFNPLIMEADIKGAPPFSLSPETVAEVQKIKAAIENTLHAGHQN
jgi:CO dehydrogenase maturation factor